MDFDQLVSYCRRQERLTRSLFALSLLALSLGAQTKSPATWTLRPTVDRVKPGSEFTVELKVQLEGPWHMYSMNPPPPSPTGAPIPTTIRLEESPAVESFRVYQPAAQRKFDPNFQMETETYDKEAVYYYRIKLKADAPAGPLELTSQQRFQLCTEKECLPPRRLPASATITVDPAAPEAPAFAVPAGYTLFDPSAPAKAPAPAPAVATQQGQATVQPLGSFLLIAFGFGLAAIFTPCVFPMIPITMSFFLSQGKRGSALAQALVFCIGIIALFTILGFGITAALGPFGVVQLGSSPWVNTFISLVFLAFGLSLLGAFEITLPSGLLTKLNSASGKGGYLGTLLMGLTFSLTSFACVGPFVGTLLAASVQGDKLQPILGMMSFSSGLALPFFLLALFPGYLAKLPRSGGWMSRVKIVMGFLVLAAMLKYLSNVDQVLQWNWLTRERYLGIWIVLFALPGLYLLGFLRLEGIKPDERLGVGRLLLGAAFLAFSLGLLPGMFGARLGELEAYVPAPAEGSSLAFGGAGSGGATAAKWIKNDVEAAFAKAKADQRRVLIAFTGYACTNCHWMKANMFTRPEIAAALGDFVLLELYTDGTDAASEANQKRQEQQFKTVAIPFYAIYSPEETVVATFAGLTKDTQQFLGFLRSGV